jgi:hypothetical protein
VGHQRNWEGSKTDPQIQMKIKTQFTKPVAHSESGCKRKVDTAVSPYIKKSEISQIHNLMIHLKI